MTHQSYRTANFESAATDAWYKRIWARLKPADLDFCRSWIAEHDGLSEGAFEMAVNRMFLDKPELRERLPRWKLISELVARCNVGHSKAHGGPDLLGL